MQILGDKVIDISLGRKLNTNELESIVSKDIPQAREIIKKICVVNDTLYYAKQVDENEAVNELIGSLLASYLNLDTVIYRVGVDSNDNLYAMSKLFYEPNYSYSHPPLNPEIDIYSLDLQKCKRFYCKDCIYALSKEMQETILKLIALDIKMYQMDRCPNNIMIKTNKLTRRKSFAPIYDYAMSYDWINTEPEKSFYDNPYIVIRKNVPSLTKLITKYPRLYYYIKKMADISMEEIISVIEKENDLLLSEDERKYYIDRDIEYSKVLKKVSRS